jgi:hypothetical protein
MNVWEWGSFEAEPSQGIRCLPTCTACVADLERIIYPTNFRVSLSPDITDAHDSDAVTTYDFFVYCETIVG